MDEQKTGVRPLCECGCGVLLSEWGRTGRRFVDGTHARRWQRVQAQIRADMPAAFTDALSALDEYHGELLTAAADLALVRESLKMLAIARRFGLVADEAQILTVLWKLVTKHVEIWRLQIECFELAFDELADVAVPGELARRDFTEMLHSAGVLEAGEEEEEDDDETGAVRL